MATITISFSWMRKLRHMGIKGLTRDHTVSVRIKIIKSEILAPKSMPFFNYYSILPFSGLGIYVYVF